MSIVSSAYTLDNHTQPDGRRYVKEIHTDNEGKLHEINYLGAVNEDYASNLAAHAAQIAETLANLEAENLING